jgi:tRNA(His) 5'-end guanylyltransferase
MSTDFKAEAKARKKQLKDNIKAKALLLTLTEAEVLAKLSCVSEEVMAQNLDQETRMGMYEQVLEPRVPNGLPYIVRLDGNCFSKFTGFLHQPFDVNFTQAMALTARDMMLEFHVDTISTHSDEFSLYFRAGNVIHSGRVMKICSELASFCALRFNYHLAKLVEPVKHTYSEALVAQLADPRRNFDARVFTVPVDKHYEFVNHLMWRSKDCKRNAISKYADQQFSHKQLEKKSGEEKITMLTEKGYDWASVPTYIQSGLICKRSSVDYETSEGEKYTRTEVVFKSFEVKFSDDKKGGDWLDLLFNKYWSEVPGGVTVHNYDVNNLPSDTLQLLNSKSS